jgi:hypothetical protein
MAANWLESRGKGRAELDHVAPTACTAQLPVVPPDAVKMRTCVCLFPQTKKAWHMNILQLTRDGFP